MEIMNTHYCNNCGNYGHLYRQCKLPVLSYGILVFNVNSGANKLLMIQRKDSISYIEFIRGKYELSNPEYIIQLFTNCSIKEKEFLKNHTFNEHNVKCHEKSHWFLARIFLNFIQQLHIQYFSGSIVHRFTSSLF